MTVPNFDFSGTTLTGADTIFDNLKAVAEAFVWDLIAQGIEAFGDAVDEAVSAAAYDVEIPVIGDLLDAGADVSNAFNTKVTDPLAGLIGSLNSAGDFTTIESSISNFFWTNLGGANSDPAQRFILNFDDPTAMPVQSEDVIVKTLCGADRHDCVDGVDDFLTLEDVQVQVAIGQAAAATTPAFDFGVPGLRLAGESTLSATVSWQVNLGFGVSLDDGFYLMSSTEMSAAIGGDDIAVIADVDFGTAPATLQDPAALTGDLAFLSAALWNAKDDRIDSGEAGDTDNRDAHEVHLQLGVDIPDPGASDNRIGLAELPNALDVTEWDVTLEGGVDLYATLATTAAVEGGAEEGTIPRLLADLSLVWSFTGNLQDGLALGDLEAGFDNIQLDLGSFISEFLDPVLSEVQKYTKPLQPIIDTLQAPIPGVSQLAELVGADPITLLDLMEAISGSDLTLIRRLLDVITFANSIPTVSPGNASLIIPLGEFLLDPVALTKPELPANTKDKLIQAGSELLDTGVSGANGVLGALSSKSGDLGSGGAAFNSQMTKATSSDGGFSFPAFKDPSQLFQLLVGKDVSLVEFDAGKLRAEVGWSQSFGPITIGPVPVSIVVSISAAVEGRFVIGYDTKGIRLLVKNLTDDSPDNDGFFESVGILFAGVYLSDLDAQGNDVPEIRLTLEGAVGAAVDLVVVKVGIEAGLRATLDMNLHDGGFLDPIPPENLDGKLRIDEIITFINNPLCLFDVSGRLEAFIRVFVTIDFFLFSATFKQTIVNIVLLELDNITAELCQPPPPVLAQPTSDGSTVLRLNSGDFAGARNYAVDEPDEKFVVRQITEGSPATVTVTAFGLTQEFPGVTKVVGEGAGGKDTFITEEGGISGVCQADGTIAPPVPGMTCNGATQAGDTITKAVPFVLPVSFCGGDDDDKLGGGTGDDRLVGDGNLADGATDCTLGAAGDGSDDTDKIAGQGGVDTIRGNDGDDSLNGDSGNDDFIQGGDGADEIIGGIGQDDLSGNEGDDNMLGGPEEDPCPGDDRDLCGNAANDSMTGGGGNDTMEGDHGRDTMNGNAGLDTMVGGLGDDTMSGGDDADNMFGNQGNDTMSGNAGDDDAYGSVGDDTINGGVDDDDLVGEEGVDTINGEGGWDVILGDRGVVNRNPDPASSTFTPSTDLLVELTTTAVPPAGGDTLNGGDDPDLMWGQEANDTMTGGAGDDVMRGNAGLDTMSGNAGADEMYGDADNDTMFGDALDRRRIARRHRHDAGRRGRRHDLRQRQGRQAVR